MRVRRGTGTGRMSAAAERDAWTAHIEGTQAKKGPKYAAKKTEGYDSAHEAKTAAKLWALQRAGHITELQEQVRIVLVPGKYIGKRKIRDITYWADFTFRDLDGKRHVVDAKGFKTDVYKLKKQLALLLLDLEIEED